MSAPASTAASTSSGRVSPQTFTSGRDTSSRSFDGGSGACISAEPTRIASAPASSAAAPCARVCTPLSATTTASCRAQSRNELELCAAVDLERRQVARVDADHLGAERDRAVQLVGVVRLDERLEPELARVREQGGRALVVDVAQDHERGVRARDLELQQLELLGEEALGEQRRSRRRPRGLEIVDRAAEALVDEDRDRSRAGVGELSREPGGIGVRPQVSGRGRAALDLGDRAETRGREGVAEPAAHVATVSREKATSCSRRSAAAPESTVSTRELEPVAQVFRVAGRSDRARGVEEDRVAASAVSAREDLAHARRRSRRACRRAARRRCSAGPRARTPDRACARARLRRPPRRRGSARPERARRCRRRRGRRMRAARRGGRAPPRSFGTSSSE